jgi:hypothetical protein
MQCAKLEDFERRTHPDRPQVAGVCNTVAARILHGGQRPKRGDERVDDALGPIENSARARGGEIARTRRP